MTTTTTSGTTTSSHGLGFVKITGWIVAVVGAIMLVAGGVTWFVVQDQLVAEKITVAEDASFLAGNDVNGPLSAYAQAEIINQHALEASEGKTYAELDREDPVRATMMNASFLRASLFTSVVAFGVALMAMALGVVQILGGIALTRVADART
jgi:hypothetical protein